MSQNLLKNGGFEADWGDEKSHRVLIFPVDDEPYEKDVGNIFTPPGWLTWFRHKPGKWDQPEVRDSWKSGDPRRVQHGEKAMLLFTFQRNHDAGFLQQVSVEPGTELRLTAWAHAWSNHDLEGHESCKDDPRCSCGVGREAAFLLEEDVPHLNGDPWNDAIGNFSFMLGIDPTGGTDPYADTVVWGPVAHIYNEYHEVPAVEATAEAETVTVFLRSKTLWAFKHNDAYWDNAELVALGEQPEEPEEPEESEEPEEPEPEAQERGQPREQYNRTYVLLPPEAGEAWALAVVDGTWDRHHYTIGGSADDAGIGDLDTRRVMAVNPDQWPTDLEAFFEEHYPDVRYIPLEAHTPDELAQKLKKL